MFGYTIFWAYIAFSQFVLIWYANIPEETEFFMVRMEGGWQYISYGLPIMHFFVPFLFLLSRQHEAEPRAAGHRRGVDARSCTASTCTGW